jgi:formylglycine-generating enzyme required for sulfatase activity
VVRSIDYKMVYIPPGTFMMGSPRNEQGRGGDETQHQVTLTKGFDMGVTEVTHGQWKKVMGSNPSDFKNCRDYCPVDSVSWNYVQEFIKKLNQQEAGKSYWLPTEAEW